MDKDDKTHKCYSTVNPALPTQPSAPSSTTYSRWQVLCTHAATKATRRAEMEGAQTLGDTNRIFKILVILNDLHLSAVAWQR